MFRSLKKKVKSLTDSSRSRRLSDDGDKLDTPRRDTPLSSTGSTPTESATAHSSFAPGGAAGALSITTKATTRKSRKLTKEEMNAKLPPKISPLIAFDKCIEASDAITASSSSKQIDSILTARKDAGTGLPDCSLLVSPDGELLLVPTGENPHVMFQKQSTKVVRPDESVESNKVAMIPSDLALDHPDLPTDETAEQLEPLEKEDEDLDESDVGLNSNVEVSDNHQASFTQLMRQSKEDYESAMFLGNDLYGGDKAMNLFSAKGWSMAATTLAVAQTGHTLAAVAHFCEQIVLSRKELAARTTIACDNLRASTSAPSEEQRSAVGTNCGTALTAEQWEILDPRATDFEWSLARTGPFTSSATSTLYAAASALEQYHFTAAEKESQRWREASLQRNGVLPSMHLATDLYYKRSMQRQKALEESSHRARIIEDLLRKLKQQSEVAWNAVYKAENRVTVRLEELMAERSRERQQARLRLLQEQNQQQQQQQQQSTEDCATTLATSLSDEVWDMVSSVAESMEQGSFEPVMGHQDALSTISDEASTSSSVRQNDETKDDTAVSSSLPPTAFPFASREKIEQEVGLPELRAAAMQVDEEIQDTSDTLLNILTTLDTARRSARIAAETNLVSAANAQAACLRSLLALERDSLLERLRDLEGLEDKIDKIDVRADLDAYITADKKERGGSSYLGDDDDGGIASALATLSSHVDGSAGLDNHSSSRDRVNSEQTDQVDELCDTTPAMLNDAVEKLFEDYPSLGPDADATSQSLADYEKNTDLLCRAATGYSSIAKGRRSTICYSLNAKRGSNARIATPRQFDAVTNVFAAILSGCNDDENGVSNAKMCMMLAQTFYTEKPEDLHTQNSLDVSNQSAQKTRRRRIYIKSKLVDHDIWSKDDFWDVALSQQISESLTHSGVMSNFDRGQRNVRRTEWTQTHKTRWHDLNYTERVEAASQVHAVVFAQLGALAHSMIELGCGLERSFAFVRRMSIRNQLPSSQRTMLLLHLMDRDVIGRSESKIADE